MPSINMIAARRAEQKKLDRRVGIAFIVAAAQLVVCIGVLSFTTARIYGAGNTIRRIETELKRVQPIVAKINDYERQISLLDPKLDLLMDSRDETLLWCSVLQHLSRSMPEKTWLVAINTTRPQPTAAPDGSAKPQELTPTVNLKGLSASQRLVGETMLRLNRFAGFERVDLGYTQKTPNPEVDTLDFQVSALIKGRDSLKEGATDDAAH